MVDFGSRSNLQTIHQDQPICTFILDSGCGEHFNMFNIYMYSLLGAKPLKEVLTGIECVDKNQGLFSKSIRGAETGHFGLILENFGPV